MNDDLDDDEFAQQLVDFLEELRQEPVPQYTSILTREKLTKDILERKALLASAKIYWAFNFDMVLEYTLCGWEGSAHDGRVLSNAHGLVAIPNKYRLDDDEYASRSSFSNSASLSSRVSPAVFF